MMNGSEHGIPDQKLTAYYLLNLTISKIYSVPRR